MGDEPPREPPEKGADVFSHARKFLRPGSPLAVFMGRLAERRIWDSRGYWTLEGMNHAASFGEIVADCSCYEDGKVLIQAVIPAYESLPIDEVTLVFGGWELDGEKSAIALAEKIHAMAEAMDFTPEELRRLSTFWARVHVPLIPHQRMSRGAAMRQTLLAMPSHVQMRFDQCFRIEHGEPTGLPLSGITVTTRWPTIGAELSKERSVDLVFVPASPTIMFGSETDNPPCPAWSLIIGAAENDARSRVKPSGPEDLGLLYWPRLSESDVDQLGK